MSQWHGHWVAGHDDKVHERGTRTRRMHEGAMGDGGTNGRPQWHKREFAAARREAVAVWAGYRT